MDQKITASRSHTIEFQEVGCRLLCMAKTQRLVEARKAGQAEGLGWLAREGCITPHVAWPLCVGLHHVSPQTP
jgi:hypothetical protein